MCKNDTILQNQTTSIQNLDMQIGQLASVINKHPQRTFPSDTQTNPRREGKKHCKVITLSSGKELNK